MSPTGSAWTATTVWRWNARSPLQRKRQPCSLLYVAARLPGSRLPRARSELTLRAKAAPLRVTLPVGAYALERGAATAAVRSDAGAVAAVGQLFGVP